MVQYACSLPFGPDPDPYHYSSWGITGGSHEGFTNTHVQVGIGFKSTILQTHLLHVHWFYVTFFLNSYDMQTCKVKDENDDTNDTDHKAQVTK